MRSHTQTHALTLTPTPAVPVSRAEGRRLPHACCFPPHEGSVHEHHSSSLSLPLTSSCWPHANPHKGEGEGRPSAPPPAWKQVPCRQHLPCQLLLPCGWRQDASSPATSGSPAWPRRPVTGGWAGRTLRFNVRQPHASRYKLRSPISSSSWISVLFWFPICLTLSSYFSASSDLVWERGNLSIGPSKNSASPYKKYLLTRPCSILDPQLCQAWLLLFSVLPDDQCALNVKPQ